MFITFQILANAKLQNSALHKIENHNDMKLNYELLMCNEVCAKVQCYFDVNFLYILPIQKLKSDSCARRQKHLQL